MRPIRCHTPDILSVKAALSECITRGNSNGERASMPELSSTLLLITAVICGVSAGAAVAAGVLVVSRRTHGRWPRGVKPGNEATDLLDRAVALDSQLGHLTNLTLEILTRQSSAATKLDSAAEMTQELHLILANPKQRGDWGEILAEDVLRHAGLQNHISYTRQQTLRYGNGRPDFTFTMPDGRELHLDAKFPLENYRRMEQGRHRRAPPTGPARRSPETSRITSKPYPAAVTPIPSTPWASACCSSPTRQSSTPSPKQTPTSCRTRSHSTW